MSRTARRTTLAAAAAVAAIAGAAVPAHAALPGQEGRIAFASTRDGGLDIYSMKVDGTDVVRLTDHPAYDTAPAWSPDGRRIAFESERDGGGRDLYVMNADGTGLRRVTSHPTHEQHPAWSPDGTRLAFRAQLDGNDEIHTVRLDGSAERRLTRSAASDGSPAWSSTNRISWTIGQYPASELWSMDPDGGKALRRTSFKALTGASDYHPSGERVVFQSERAGGEHEIYTMRYSGKDVRRLTENGEWDGHPVYSPTGARIAYASGGDILVMAADGTAKRSITSGPAEDLEPAWQPLR